MVKGFKDFLLRGNVIDLAVAVVVGMAFSRIVDALATDVIGGLIGVVGGVPDFGDAGIEANGGKVVLGSTVNAVVNFLIVSAVVYFAVVMPVQRLMERRNAGEEPEMIATPEDIALLKEIRDLLKARGGQL